MHYSKLLIFSIVFFICASNVLASSAVGGFALRVNKTHITEYQIALLATPSLNKAHLERVFSAIPEKAFFIAAQKAWANAIHAETRRQVLLQAANSWLASSKRKQVDFETNRQLAVQRRNSSRRTGLNYSHAESEAKRIVSERFNRLINRMHTNANKQVASLANSPSNKTISIANEAEKRKRWEEQFKIEVYVRNMAGYINATPSEVRSYYNNHPDEFKKPSHYTLRHIFLSKSRYNNSVRGAMKAAELVHKELLSGTDFASVAKHISDDEFAKNGGLMTQNKKSSLPLSVWTPTIRSMMKNAKYRTLTPPKASRQGAHILFVENIESQGYVSFKEESKKISNRITYDRYKKASEEIYKKQKNNAYIEVITKYVPSRLLKLQVEPMYLF